MFKYRKFETLPKNTVPNTLLCFELKVIKIMSAPAPNPKSQMAEAYVQKHRIPELFENMTAALIHSQPGKIKIRFLLKV